VNLQTKDCGKGGLSVYIPPDTRRKLIKARINELSVSICDTTLTLIPFNSGTVNIECIID
jgi:hypothetical protein